MVRKMILTIFDSVTKAYFSPEQVVDSSWDEIANVLTQFHLVETKDDMELFNTWQFNLAGEQGRKYHDKSKKDWSYIPNTVRRCSDNAQGLWGLMLDFDKKATIEQVVADLDGIEYVLYTTFSHSSEQDKFRVVAPFTRMMTTAEFEAKKESIAKTFPLADTASFSMSQSFYFHCGRKPWDAIAFRVAGEMIDPASFEDKKIYKIEALKRDITTIKNSEFEQLEALLKQLREIYPVPDYKTWLSIMFATASEIGDDGAAVLLSTIWPEQKQGEYTQHLHGRSSSRSPTIATLVYMVNEHYTARKPKITNTNKF